MKAQQRRNEIIALLRQSDEPLSGASLSETLGASRQIIVQDIALLRAQGFDIIPTHNGYVLKSTPLIEKVFKVRHTSMQTEDELNTIVDNGGTVLDVFVWHKVYGKVRAPLNIFSRRGVCLFIDGIKSGRSTELMNITDGYHYHTVSAETNEALCNIEKALAEKGYTVPEI